MTGPIGRGSVVLMSIPRVRFWNVILVVAGAAGLIINGEVQAKGGLPPGDFVLAVAAAAPLAWGQRAPLPALAGVAAGAIVCDAAFPAGCGWAATGLVAVQLFMVALLGDRQRSLIVGVLTAIVVIAAIVALDGGVDAGSVAIRVPLAFAVLAFGDTARSRRALHAAAREREEREAREREEEARRRATEERLRIARELHDTLAHSLVAINVRAGVALDLHDSQDPTEALQDVKLASAAALRDLRATLSLLRDQGEVAPTAPAFDLEALSGLVENARTAGVRADMDVDADNATVPSAVGGAAFRIVQEALTNILRHADATSASVRVRAMSDALDIEITDDGRANGAGVTPGHGLRGMVERAAALGGRVHAGPRDDGGWRVHAVLPLNGRGTRPALPRK
jgi:signal transduction histidine kinase